LRTWAASFYRPDEVGAKHLRVFAAAIQNSPANHANIRPQKSGASFFACSLLSDGRF
jgi:hypothetical protein